MRMPVTARRFTVEEYHRMGEAGILREDDRVELLDGEIVEMSPIGPRHANCVDRLTRLLSRLAADRAIVRVQNPVIGSTYDEPQPDVALLQPPIERYQRAHPHAPDLLLVIEVADTSLRKDRERKLPLYAAARVPEVWLVDLPGERLAVYRDPQPSGYAAPRLAARGDTLTLLALPDVAVAVTDILGPPLSSSPL